MWSRLLTVLLVLAVPALAAAQGGAVARGLPKAVQVTRPVTRVPTTTAQLRTILPGRLSAQRTVPEWTGSAAAVHRLLIELAVENPRALTVLPRNERLRLLSELLAENQWRFTALRPDERLRPLSELVTRNRRWLTTLRPDERVRLLGELLDENHSPVNPVLPDQMFGLLMRFSPENAHLFTGLSVGEGPRLVNGLFADPPRNRGPKNKRLETVPDQEQPTTQYSRRSDSDCPTRPTRRNCVPRLALSDGRMTLSLECRGGQKFSTEFPVGNKADNSGAALSSVASEAREVLFWLSIMNSPNPAWLRAYLDQFPSGALRPLAEARLAALHSVAHDTFRIDRKLIGLDATFLPEHTVTETQGHVWRPNADWQWSLSLGCGVLTVDVSMITGKVKATLFGIVAIGSDGQGSFIVRHGAVSFETSGDPVPVVGVDNNVRDVLFWHLVADSPSRAELAAYLTQFPTGIFSQQAHVRLAELRARTLLLRHEELADRNPGDELLRNQPVDVPPIRHPVDSTTQVDLDRAIPTKLKTGGFADVILAEWVNALNRPTLLGLPGSSD